MSSPQGEAPAAAPSRSGSKKWLVLATAVLLLGGGVVAFQRRERTSVHGERKPVAFEPGVLELEPFVLNLADQAGDRYVRIVVRLVLDQAAIARRAASGLGQVKLRDRILTVLSRKRAGDMTSLESKEHLREEIVAAREALLDEPPLQDEASDPPPRRGDSVFFKAT